MPRSVRAIAIGNPCTHTFSRSENCSSNFIRYRSLGITTSPLNIQICLSIRLNVQLRQVCPSLAHSHAHPHSLAFTHEKKTCSPSDIDITACRIWEQQRNGTTARHPRRDWRQSSLKISAELWNSELAAEPFACLPAPRPEFSAHVVRICPESRTLHQRKSNLEK